MPVDIAELKQKSVAELHALAEELTSPTTPACESRT